MIAPSISLAQSSKDVEKFEIIDEFEITEDNLELIESYIGEDEFETQAIGLIARLIIQGGQRFLQVLRGGAVVGTYKLVIHMGQQGKHILGHPNYIPGRSVLRADPHRLLQNKAGKGTMVNEHKERVNFGEDIGDYLDLKTNHYYPTTNGIIHYGKNGAHIVPAAP